MMKNIIFLIILLACAFCLFQCECKVDAEVLGGYSVIDGFNQQNSFHPQSQSENQQQTNEQQKQLSSNHAIPHEGTASTSTSTSTSTVTSQSAIPRVPILNYNSAVARKIGLSTLMMSGVLYGLTMLPALLAVTGAGPLASLFSSLGRRKRSLVNESHIFRQMPLLDNEETLKFLTLFESTLQARKIWSPSCKGYYTCKVYHNVIKSGEKPTLATFENAILNVFGIAAERKDFKVSLVPTVKMYYNIAKDALDGKVCALKYPCSLQANNHQNITEIFKSDLISNLKSNHSIN